MLAVVVAVLIAYDYDCARTLWASRPFGGEAGLARRESLQLRPCWPNIEPQMIGQKEEKKAELRGPFRGPTSGPQNQPSIGKGANCRSKNWPRFWGQIWCCKRVFSVCMCSLKWIRGACTCPGSWPGVKNTIADLGVQLSQKLLLYVRYGDFSRLFCSMFFAVHMCVCVCVCVCVLAVVVAVLIAYDYDCARTLWASRPFGGEAGLARRESLQLRPCWPNIEPQMIGQKEEKKAELRGPFRGPTSGPQNQPSIGKGANCRSKNWPRFWGQIWCCKRVFSVCMCSLKWIRGACICPASWPGVKNTIADLGVQLAQKIIALCPLWWFQPPILQHVFCCAQWGPTATKPEMLVFETPETGPM